MGPPALWVTRISAIIAIQQRAEESMDAKDPSSVVETRPGSDPEVQTGESGGGGEGRIRCPLCGWTPRAGNVWLCKCGHMWNTFDTGGVCPKCLFRWMDTCCLSCHRWSRHSDWYPKE